MLKVFMMAAFLLVSTKGMAARVVANGGHLGKLVGYSTLTGGNASPWLTVMTDTGYFFSFYTQAPAVQALPVYFTEKNCTGKASFQSLGVPGRQIVFDSVAWWASDPQAVEMPTTFQSYRYLAGCKNEGLPDYPLVPLQPNNPAVTGFFPPPGNKFPPPISIVPTPSAEERE